MNWEFMFLGANLVKIYGEKIFKKYLQFHMSFFDLD